MSARARVEVHVLKSGFFSNEIASHVVMALRLANRVVEVEWDGTRQSLVFFARIPLPRKVKLMVGREAAAEKRRA